MVPDLDIDDLALNYDDGDTDGFKIETRHVNINSSNTKTLDYMHEQEDYHDPNQ